MSQRYYEVGSLQVMLGWDRPMQEYYLNVFDMAAGIQSDEVVYSTIGDEEFASNPHVRVDVGFILRRLSEQGLPAPKYLRADLLQDRERDAGNERHYYEPGQLEAPDPEGER